DELVPVAVAGRVDGVDDQAHALRRGENVSGVHRVALHPLEAWLLACRARGVAAERAVAPAAPAQRPRHAAADAAGRAENQNRPLFRSTHDGLRAHEVKVAASAAKQKCRSSCFCIHQCMDSEPSWDLYRTFLGALERGSPSLAATARD